MEIRKEMKARVRAEVLSRMKMRGRVLEKHLPSDLQVIFLESISLCRQLHHSVVSGYFRPLKRGLSDSLFLSH